MCRTLKSFYGLLVDSLQNSIRDYKSRVITELEEDRIYYLCRENNRLYKNKPRNCREYIEVTPREYARIKASGYFSADVMQASVWEWLASNCNSKLCIDSYYPESGRVFFTGGFMHVIGIEQPILVVYLRDLDATRMYRGLLACLENAPFRVDVYLGPVGPALRLEDVISMVRA